jgi:hypothetical protein
VGAIKISDLEGEALGEYDGSSIVDSSLKFSNMGAAFSDGMKVARVRIPIGTEFDIVLRCKVVSHEHDPVKVGKDEEPTDDLVLAHVAKAMKGTFVDPDLLEPVWAEHAKRVSDAKAGSPPLSNPED